eukprot:gene1702-1057_t
MRDRLSSPAGAVTAVLQDTGAPPGRVVVGRTPNHKGKSLNIYIYIYIEA